MSDPRWQEAEDWVVDRLIGHDDALDAAVANAGAGGLPAIAVDPAMGKLLQLIARMVGAQRILEVGTLGGYSTIWLARGLPEDGQLITLEANPDFAAVAQQNIAHAGLSDRVDLRVGPALESLPKIKDEGGPPFDMVFIDADKANQDNYLAHALELTRLGSVIVGDNVIRRGASLEADSDEPNTQGIRRFMDLMHADPRIDATAIQTVGSKGWDGFALGLVVED